MIDRLSIKRNSPSPLRRAVFCAAVSIYVLAWLLHIYFAVTTLRGFFDDSSLSFLIYLSKSYMFEGSGSLIHLFSVGFPRDAQILINGLSLQAALWMNVTSPAILKNVFLTWEYVLPGLLYILLFIGLWRTKNGIWIVFPLISWAVLSVPVDSIPINSTRIAVPLFWAHFCFILLSKSSLTRWPTIACCLLGLLMWVGLYESVVLQCGLCFVVAAVRRYREKTSIPLIYATAAFPGACRAVLSFMATGHSAPNSFDGFILPHHLNDPYFFLIGYTLVVVGATLTYRHIVIRALIPILISFLIIGFYVLSAPPEIPITVQYGARYDYVFGSLLLCTVMAIFKLYVPLDEKALRLSILFPLVAGLMLWTAQLQQTLAWQECRIALDNERGHTPILIDDSFAFMIKPAPERWSTFQKNNFRQCLGSYAPWTDLLLSTTGEIDQWRVPIFWQDFGFENIDGTIYFHTNQWTLTIPSVLVSNGRLPLKTRLYDLTPLYQKVGGGPLLTRTTCLPVETTPALRKYFLNLNDEKREKMFMCRKPLS